MLGDRWRGSGSVLQTDPSYFQLVQIEQREHRGQHRVQLTEVVKPWRFDLTDTRVV